MTIYFDEDCPPDSQTAALMEKAASLALQGEGLSSDTASLSLCFASAEEIRSLNRDYRGVDRATDVLSFPAYDDLGEAVQGPELALGDVVICREKAKEQAEEYGHSMERELLYLFVHSVLHLLGYDHIEEEDRRMMRQKEEAVMAALGLARE